MRTVVGCGVLCGMLGLVGGMAWADGFPGSGGFEGTAKLKIQGCGKAKQAAIVDVVVAADGTWRVADGESTLAGTGTIGGKGRRTLVLSPDAESLGVLSTRLAAEAGTLCGTTIAVTELSVRKALLKVNRKETRARLVLVVGGLGTSDGGESGIGKLRLTAGGAWTGPLSCEEVFACTETCAVGDDVCIDACLDQGSLATQDAVRALTACVDAACPQGDPVCVANALAGACKEEFETCVPPPPPTNMSCEEVLDCARACPGQRCVDDCYERGSEQGRTDATAVARCVSRVCPGGGAACEAAALAYACAYVWEDCSGTSPPRNFSCGEILTCQSTCASGNGTCLADCRARGSITGQSQLAALEVCVETACPTGDRICISNTITGQCKTQWETCLG